MIIKPVYTMPCRALFTFSSEWVENNRLALIGLVIILCIVLFFYGFIYTIDAFAHYAIQKRHEALDIQSQQLEKMIRDIEKLQFDVRQREASLVPIYERVLKREGRLTEKHVVRGAASRLAANDNFLISREAASVSRSYPRYSPYHFDVTMPSAVTAYELEKVLEPTDLKGLGRSFVQAELTYGINAIFLTALAIHESRWGTSVLAQEKNNLFGFAAYDANPYLYAETFISKHECVLYVARFLRDNYISGQYSNGRNISDINYKYASDEQWGYKIFMLVLQIDNEIQEIFA